jgi:hypothetical protein
MSNLFFRPTSQFVSFINFSIRVDVLDENFCGPTHIFFNGKWLPVLRRYHLWTLPGSRVEANPAVTSKHRLRITHISASRLLENTLDNAQCNFQLDVS